MRKEKLKNGQKWAAQFHIEMTQDGEITMGKVTINPSKNTINKSKGKKQKIWG